MSKDVLRVITLLFFFLFSTSYLKAEESSMNLGVLPSFTMKSKKVIMEGMVESINLQQRKITLKGAGGDLVTVEANPKLKNLSRLKTGDLIKMVYKNSIVWKLVKTIS